MMRHGEVWKVLNNADNAEGICELLVYQRHGELFIYANAPLFEVTEFSVVTGAR